MSTSLLTDLSRVTDSDSLDKPQCKCAVFGIFNSKSAGQLCYFGLHSLQHRGQESAGIATLKYDDKKNKYIAAIKKDFGLVLDVFNDGNIFNNLLSGTAAIGHTRYSTSGSDINAHNIQPFLVRYQYGNIMVAHNGNISNAPSLHRHHIEKGVLFQSTSDSELVLHLMAQSKEPKQINQLLEACRQLEGAFSFCILTDQAMFGVRDPNGFRPLCLGRVGPVDQSGGAAYCLASETCAFDLIGAVYIRDIEPGEIIMITKDGCETGGNFKSFSIMPADTESKYGTTPCVFEYIYFSRPDSLVFGKSVAHVRHLTGVVLAQQHPVPDVGPDELPVAIVAVPDSANVAALGYANKCKEMGLNCSYEIGIVRNHYVGRTFISPNQDARELKVRCKFNTVRRVLENRIVFLIDDSIVRGTTSKQLIKMVRDAGAKEVHFRVSSPPVVSPCYYGMDFPSKKELLANNFPDIDKMCKWLGADSVAYLSIDGLLEAVSKTKSDTYCTACFTSKYPVPIEEYESKQDTW